MNYYWIFSKIYKIAAKKMCRECTDFIEKNSEILDLGCGSGVVGEEFQNFFNAKVFGIDIQDRRIKKIPFQIFDGFNIPFPDNFFDIVLISYVLHHAKNPILLLKEANRVAKKKIIIYEDLPEGFFSKIYCFLHGVFFDKIFGNPNQTVFKTEREWKRILNDIGLKLIFKKRISNFPIKKQLFIVDSS